MRGVNPLVSTTTSYPVTSTGRHPNAQPQHYAVFAQHCCDVRAGLIKFLFAGNVAGHVELAADEIIGLEQCYLVPALGDVYGCGQSGRTSPDDRY